MAPSDYVAIEGLMATVKQLGISELTIRRSDVAFSLKGDGASSSPAQAAPLADAPLAAAPAAGKEAPAAPVSPDNNYATINAPLTGSFYRSSGLNKPNFVEEGGTLKGGEAICIIEAMKLFNQIKVEKPCKVIKFLVMHGGVVQKGTPLAQVEYL
jgi:acetyl-CoA carboxylase biotin carboxyl carrier protein